MTELAEVLWYAIIAIPIVTAFIVGYYLGHGEGKAQGLDIALKIENYRATVDQIVDKNSEGI